MVTVLSVGGSIVAPQTPDVDFLRQFTLTIREWLKGDAGRKIIMVVGGGAPARSYQDAYRKICGQQGATASDNEADWIGITATYLNAQLLKACFADLCPNSVVYNPTEPSIFAGQVLIAAGWKPGFSTDYDPRKNPDAKPIDKISWDKFIEMVGTEWTPGKNLPFDPIASAKARKMGLKVICASGKNIENLKNILNEKSFVGTTIQA